MSIKRLKIKRVKGNVVRVKKGGEHMDANGRYCSVLESIEESFIQVNEYNNGKRKFKSLEESQKLWDKWANEDE